MSKNKGTVVVAMSGGVDSSTAAYILKDQGYNIIGITMRLFDDDAPESEPQNRPCCSTAMTARAAAVCRQIGAPHYLVDFREEFRREVMDDFYEQYISGRTPNPCVRCNTFIKWEPLVRKKNELGADFIATGHYARIIRNDTNGNHELHRGIDSSKDQSYFLWGLTGENLGYTLFPLGGLSKKEVREMASGYKLASAETPESQDICFIPDKDYRTFIQSRLNSDGKTIGPGMFFDTDGNELGQHDGFHNFTVGQRKKLGISIGRKIFVKEIRPDENAVILADEEELASNTLIAESVNWINGLPGNNEKKAYVKIRYRDPGSEAILEPLGNNSVRVVFDSPVKAVTPGQSTVFYIGDKVTGGGIITG